MKGAFDWAAIAVSSACNIFPRLTVASWLQLDPREKISSPIQDLFCSRKPLTYPGSACVQLLDSTVITYIVIFQTNI